jgi:ribonuclease HII
MDPYEFDEAAGNRKYSLIAGIDEAGRGPLAGPVVAAAVVLGSKRIDGLRDSKKVPETERDELFREIMSTCCVSTGMVAADEIDRINILNATKKAMFTALANLDKMPDLVLIDAITIPGLSVPQMAFIKGDYKSACIAAASIIAKVTRDRIMIDYHSTYPQYGFDRHKGYATSDHIKALKKYGPCLIHRRSFAPVINQELPFD